MGFHSVDDFAISYAHQDMDVNDANLQVCLRRKWVQILGEQNRLYAF